MRPMSVREMDALCYERGIEFDPADVQAELHEMARVIVGHPAWDGHSAAQELHERREKGSACRPSLGARHPAGGAE